MNECDWNRNRKTAVAFTGAADVAFAADARNGQTRQIKGKP